MGQEISEENIFRTLLDQFVRNKLDLTQRIKVEHKNISVSGLNLNRTEKELGQ
jgi:hypothetical protein